MSSSLDPNVSRLASRLQAASKRHNEDKLSDDEIDEDEIFAELEAEIEDDSGPGMAHLREQGILALKQEIDKVKDMKATGYGRYGELTDEKDVIRTSANEPRCVIHFYHGNFKRCALMDKHLAAIAPKYFSTLFFRVFVENVPWLVEKLAIKVLPCVVSFVDGVSKDRLIGFEELGNNDNFTTATLELRLSQSGVLAKPQSATIPTMYGTSSSSRPGRGNLRKNTHDDDGSDLDI